MRMIDRRGVGCPMCSRIPVPNEEEMGWLRAGQPLSSLLAEAYDKQKNSPEEPEAAAASDSGDAVDTMNNTMDELEKLFGFGDAPEAPAEPEKPSESDYDPLIEEDTKFEPLMCFNNGENYLVSARRLHAISFCPFCGVKLTETA